MTPRNQPIIYDDDDALIDIKMSVRKIVIATGIATAVVLAAIPRAMNAQPSSRISRRTVSTSGKSVLNIL